MYRLEKFNGNHVLVIEDNGIEMRFGRFKANLIIKHLDAVKRFAEKGWC